VAQQTTRLAKLSRPTLGGIYSRERLFLQLDDFRGQGTAIWVAGPPGSGKTTLIADYLDTFAVDYAWYQVDEADADVATFFYYMSQVLENRDTDSLNALPTFSAQYLNDIPAFARRFFREFFRTLSAPFAVVFDNYQEIPVQSRFHEIVQCAMEEIPDGGCIVIISRGDAPPIFARQRANRHMLTLTWNELRLTKEESDSIASIRGFEIGETASEQLYERTQGWAAGIVLMLEHMRGEGTVIDMPTTFTPGVIFDYLAGEVIKHFDEEHQQFLLQTSMLPHFTAALASDLTGRDDAGTILENVNRHDYFISAKHTETEIAYQFHPLLREFLLRRAPEVLGAEAVAKLQTRAAELLEESGQFEEAIALRIANHEWTEIARLIQNHAGTILAQGRRETLERWLEELPRTRVQKDPWLLCWLGECRLPIAPRESRRQHEQAYDLFREQSEPDVEGLFKACGGALGAILHDLDDLTLLDRWVQEVESLHQHYPDFPQQAYGEWTTCHMYMALVFRQPFHPDVERWGERTYAIFRSTVDDAVRLQAALVLVSGIVWTGRFAKATELIESIRQLAAEPEVSPLVLTTLRMVESMYYMLIGEKDRCLEAVRSGVETAQTAGIHIWENSTLLNGAGGALSAGDLETAEILLGRIDQSALSARRFDSCIYHLFCAWLAVLKGDVLDAYQQQRKSLRLASDMGLPFFEVLGSMALAQILFECGDQRKGAMYLREVRRVAKTINNRYLEFMSLLIYAAVALEHGRQSSGLNALQYALKLGREMGYTSFIWWQPRMMTRLAAIALQNGIETEYVKGLIRRRGLRPDNAIEVVEDWPWPFRIRAFGRFSLERDEQADAFRGKHGRPMDLLKVAVALGGKEVSVERIMDALWPRIDADYAYRSFNTTLHRLRKLLGDDEAILLQGGRLSLNENWFWIDLWAFEHLSTSVLDLLRGSHEFIDAKQLIDLGQQIFKLYQGPMLGDDDAAWAIAAREREQNKLVRCISGIARYLIDHGHVDDAISFLEQGLEVDELAEALYRQLMLCYQQLDRKAEAIEVFDRCRKTLAAQLDTRPAPETDQIYQRLMAG